MYTADFQAVIEHHSLLPHFYADDVQINGSAKPSVVPQLHHSCWTALMTSSAACAATVFN
jgi:hypothetical protein